VAAEARPEPSVAVPTFAPLPVVRAEGSAPDLVAERAAAPAQGRFTETAAPRSPAVAAAGTRPLPANVPAAAAPVVESPAVLTRPGAEPVELHIGQVEVFVRDSAPPRAATARPPRAGPSASRLHLRRL
jgi:hypothetical protein